MVWSELTPASPASGSSIALLFSVLRCCRLALSLSGSICPDLLRLTPMSRAHDIDNEPSVYQQDSHIASSAASSTPPTTAHDHFTMSLDDSDPHFPASEGVKASVPAERNDALSSINYSSVPSESSPGKGKGVLLPIDVQAEREGVDDLEIFPISLDSATLPPDEGDISPLSPSIGEFLSSDIAHGPEPDHNGADMRTYGSLEQAMTMADKGKGKGKDLPPTLPPLTFSPTEFNYDHMYPSSAISTEPGPSSFGSTYAALMGRDSSTLRAAVDNSSPPQADPVSALTRLPSRRRSTSNISIHSTHSLAARSMSRIKMRLGSSKGPAALARKLFPKRGDQSNPPSTPSSPTTPEQAVDYEFDGATCGTSCFGPWKLDPRSRTRDAPNSLLTSNIDIDRILSEDAGNVQGYFPIYPTQSNYADVAHAKNKSRSYSNPFPISSIFDEVPPVTAPAYTPAPVVLVLKSFDEVLPRELRLHIFDCLVQIHEEEHALREREGKWTVLKAASSKHKWVGRDQGVRELVKLSRVCKSWMSLVFDGQLWTQLNLHAFPKMPASQLLHIATSAGPFIRTLDVAGHANLLPSTLQNLTSSLALHFDVLGELPCTRLTAINLSGCHALTTTALHHLLKRCPALKSISLKGLGAVTNETCELLYEFCPKLTILDMSRCTNLSGAGIRILSSCTIKDSVSLALKELRLSGMKGITDSVLDALGKAAPDLEVLDLSYCRDLHNSSLEAFVSCPEDYTEGETVLLSAREAGHPLHSQGRYRRRVTRLRHLSLSCCVLLTDIACSHLAHAMPRLEFLELGGIGADLKDEGLVRMLKTLPNLRKLDLEDATDITDAVLEAITPPPSPQDPDRGPPLASSEPGTVLEHLVISCATHLSNDALSTLIRSCPKLRVLEADSTGISGAVVKQFTAAVRAREIEDAIIVAVDCRGVGENVVKELAAITRPRRGRRSYDARKLGYLDGRDNETLGVGQDECDRSRVVLKTYYSWQTVDAVIAARQKRKRNRREGTGSSSSGASELYMGRARWWSPGGRRSSGVNSPSLLDVNNERDGCIIM
ncbi:hypothetical protein EW146_g7756 [Bondarzewia mesenterica]|uniref:F-box domain-containing protein n=1 Tax=Bondarzewia mesenterica TaxID=1095465 RepID=A0A4S4LJP8_9AGAM|nr:hypothetical protein EW146_g7756 [Bondarzewia mesenterica]